MLAPLTDLLHSLIGSHDELAALALAGDVQQITLPRRAAISRLKQFFAPKGVELVAKDEPLVLGHPRVRGRFGLALPLSYEGACTPVTI